jgi:hypothetical protein
VASSPWQRAGHCNPSRSVAPVAWQVFVHLFNENEIKVLICTSTLIEGVNTSAANVFIYDKKINRKRLFSPTLLLTG